MHHLIEILIRHGYLVLFVGVSGEQLGLPLPAGILLLGAGAVAGGGQLNFTIAFLMAAIGCLLSDYFWYMIGRYRGRSLLSSLCRITL